MGTNRTTTTRQLESAKEALKSRVATLKQAGSESKDFDRDPQWRNLNARVRQINSRLRAITEVETNNAAIEQLRVDNLAKRAEKKAAKKKPAEKAEKQPAKAKAKGDAKAAKPKKDKPAEKSGK